MLSRRFLAPWGRFWGLLFLGKVLLGRSRCLLAFEHERAILRLDYPITKRYHIPTWPSSLDVMGWQIEEDGFGVLFSRDIPALIRANYRPALDDFLADSDLKVADIDAFVCHPGGAKVVDVLETTLGLPAGSLVHARAVLREYGNISAASVLFVLKRVKHTGVKGKYLLSALGPGFTVGFLLLDV